MPGGVERRDVFVAAEKYGWTVDDRPNGKGYFKVRCSCGEHMHWLHKTPSNPNYYRNFIAKMRRECPGEGGGG